MFVLAAIVAAGNRKRRMTVSNHGAFNGLNVATAAAHRMSQRLNGKADQLFTKLLMLSVVI